MSKQKTSPLAQLPHGELGAFFGTNCFYNLHVICPQLPRDTAAPPQDPVPWPGLPLSFTANVKAGALRMS